MKLLLFLLLSLPLVAQTRDSGVAIVFSPPSGACAAKSAMRYYSPAGTYWGCSLASFAALAGTWTQIGSSSGGTVTSVGLSKTDDTNVTATITGSPVTTSGTINLALGWTGSLGLSRGGTHADLSATGGTSQVLKQTSVGANVSVARLACADLSDSGAGCTGTSGSSTSLWWTGTGPNVVQGDWTIFNGATESFSSGRSAVTIAANAGVNLMGKYKSAPSTPYSVVFGFQLLMQTIQFEQAAIGWSDGTKYTACLVGTNSGTNSVLGTWEYHYSTVNANANAGSPVRLYAGTQLQYYKLADDGTNLTCSWSPDGVTYYQIYQEARTSFLSSPSRIFYGGDSNVSNRDLIINLLYFN